MSGGCERAKSLGVREPSRRGEAILRRQARVSGTVSDQRWGRANCRSRMLGQVELAVAVAEGEGVRVLVMGDG